MSFAHAAWLVIAFAALVTGCGGMKETFNYQTAPHAARQTESRGAPSCKTPLRVAVTSFTDARVNKVYGADQAAAAMLAGIILAPPTSEELSHPAKGTKLYVHDDRRLLALALYAELEASGCFAEVALDPLDESQYDLVFTGTIRRLGLFRESPFVPVPLYIGSLISLAATKQTALLEVDLFARRPGMKKPSLSYGLAGSCSDCSRDNVSDSFARSLRAGNADFMAKLRGYLGRRSPAFWREYQARRDRERRLALDPELARLATAARTQPEPTRTRLATALEQKKARLNELIGSERDAEMRWARTSRARCLAELDASNHLAADTHGKFVRAAVLGALVAVGTAGVTGTTENMQSDAESGASLAMKVSGNPERMALLDAKTRRTVERIRAARKSAPNARLRAIEQYRRETGRVADLLAEAEREAASQPQAARTR